MYDEEPRYITGPNRKRSTRDPFVARIGLIVVGFVMLLPVAIFLRPDSGATVKTSGLPGAVAVLQPAVAVASVDTAPISNDGTTGSGTATDLSQTSPSDAASPAEALPASPTLPAAETLPPAETLPAAQTLPPAATQADSTALSGGSATTKRKSANATTAEAPATTKSARTTTTTVAPTTTAAPAKVTVPAQATKVPPATSAAKAPVTTATKTVQTTTAPKQTTKPAPTTTTTTTVAPKNYSAAEVQAIIVSIWPADQQTQALAIAWRESNDKPTAQNFCCYGLFQIHYQANQAWLNSVGISNPAQLFDPKTNAYIALLMYQRSGWAPWNA